MKALDAYDIHFRRLKTGKHEFTYEPEADFFDHFTEGIVKKGPVKVHVFLEKESESLIRIRFELGGHASLICDKCTSSFQYELDKNFDIIVKLKLETDEEEAESEDEIHFIGPDDTKINVATHIYEFLNLSVPMKRHCKNPGNEAQCDKTVLRKLEQIKLKKEETDPRWDDLKKLFKN